MIKLTNFKVYNEIVFDNEGCTYQQQIVVKLPNNKLNELNNLWYDITDKLNNICCNQFSYGDNFLSKKETKELIKLLQWQNIPNIKQNVCTCFTIVYTTPK